MVDTDVWRRSYQAMFGRRTRAGDDNEPGLDCDLCNQHRTRRESYECDSDGHMLEHPTWEEMDEP